MHIISGKYRRRRIDYPKNKAFRPTKAMVRKAVFDIIGNRIHGAHFLDLCSGCGAIGFEAESRGAHTVVCVDRDSSFLTKNHQSLQSSARIIRSDVRLFLKKVTQSFDIIYVDPVWADHAVYHDVYACIQHRQCLLPDGYAIFEHDASLVLPYDESIRKQYTYGKTMLTMLS